MKRLVRNTAFNTGYWVVISIFLFLNLIPSSETNEFSNIIIDRGFPFLMFREGISSNYSAYIFWSGLMANVANALISGLAAGLIFKFIQDRNSRRVV